MFNLKAMAVGIAFSAILPVAAFAANGYATANVNLRAGPSTLYPAVTVIPVGSGVDIFGCMQSANWCDVGFAGIRGWVSGSYLQALYDDRRVEIGPRYYAPLGIPSVTFSVDNYWERHYRSRDFYRDRDRWDRWDRRGPPPRGDYAPPPRYRDHDGRPPRRDDSGWRPPRHDDRPPRYDNDAGRPPRFDGDAGRPPRFDNDRPPRRDNDGGRPPRRDDNRGRQDARPDDRRDQMRPDRSRQEQVRPDRNRDRNETRRPRRDDWDGNSRRMPCAPDDTRCER